MTSGSDIQVLSETSPIRRYRDPETGMVATVEPEFDGICNVIFQGAYGEYCPLYVRAASETEARECVKLTFRWLRLVGRLEVRQL